MKEKLKKTLIPLDPEFLKSCFIYIRETCLFTEYKLKFEELAFEGSFKIHHLPTIYMLHNGLRHDFKRELILHVMKSVKETFLLALELEITTFRTKEQLLHVRDMDTMLTSAPRSSVLSVKI